MAEINWIYTGISFETFMDLFGKILASKSAQCYQIQYRLVSPLYLAALCRYSYSFTT